MMMMMMVMMMPFSALRVRCDAVRLANSFMLSVHDLLGRPHLFDPEPLSLVISLHNDPCLTPCP